MALLMNQTTGQMFGGSGPNHAPGLVPDPGSVTGASPYRFVREDGTWSHPAFSDLTGGLTVPSNAILYGSSGSVIAGVGFGTLNQVLASTGTNTPPTWVTPIASPVISFNTTVFNVAGTLTYTPSSGLAYSRVTACAGGGGGGGCNTAGSTNALAGAGGGGGGIAIGTFSALVLGASQTIVIGAGGLGGVGTVGAAGGVTTFGTLITCNGGLGGGTFLATTSSTIGQVAGALGGTASGGQVNQQGSAGRQGQALNSSTFGFAWGGEGAPGLNGAGAGTIGNPPTGTTDGASGNAGTSYGAGGAGAYMNLGGSTTLSGGNGFVGIVIVEETIFAP